MSKTCFVECKSGIYEINTKGIEVKEGDVVVISNQYQYSLGRVINKPIGQTNYIGNKTFVVHVIDDTIHKLKQKANELDTRIANLKDLLRDGYITNVENTNNSDLKKIEISDLEKEYVELQEEYKEIVHQINEWNAL